MAWCEHVARYQQEATHSVTLPARRPIEHATRKDVYLNLASLQLAFVYKALYICSFTKVCLSATSDCSPVIDIHSNVSDSSSEDDISEDELLPEGDRFILLRAPHISKKNNSPPTDLSDIANTMSHLQLILLGEPACIAIVKGKHCESIDAMPKRREKRKAIQDLCELKRKFERLERSLIQ
nr:unnamed protein product [Callosobruchus analis]